MRLKNVAVFLHQKSFKDIVGEQDQITPPILFERFPNYHWSIRTCLVDQ